MRLLKLDMETLLTVVAVLGVGDLVSPLLSLFRRGEGMGLFSLPFLARIRFTRNVFSADILQQSPLQKTLVNISPTLPEP